jgi:hypothetical protein
MLAEVKAAAAPAPTAIKAWATGPEQTTPPTAASVTQEYGELCSSCTGERVDKGEAFNESVLGDPLTLLAQLGLHEAHDGRPTIGHDTKLEETRCDFLPRFRKSILDIGNHVRLS